jgi:hypothetical protein
MEENNNIVKAYVGNEAAALLLKARLEEAGISALIKNDYSGAWLLGVPPAIDLYIQESDLKEAEPIIKDFLHDNPR